MSGRHESSQKTAQKRLARLLRGRTEPHGIEITDESILKGVEVDDSGLFSCGFNQTRAHCPCCINDLMELRSISSINKREFLLVISRLLVCRKLLDGLLR